MSNSKMDHDQGFKMPQYSGKRGAEWREFKRQLIVFSSGKFAKDDKHSYLNAYKGMDDGGTAEGAPALPNNATALQKQVVRRQEAFVYLYKLQDDDRRGRYCA